MAYRRTSFSCPPPTTSAPPLSAPLSISGGEEAGVVFEGVGTKGRLRNCDITANKAAGVGVGEGADPWVSNCRCVPSLSACT